uniref:CS domain-containing protein n=1 Tax=Cuerna arida TaxID=1464854 RepID=A0A1B6F5A7_9HEMI
MSSSVQLRPPPTVWAQNSYHVFVTFNVEDCKDPEIKLEQKSIYFKGNGGTDKKDYEVLIELYGEILPDDSKVSPSGRVVELKLVKKAPDSSSWPALTKDKVKFPWLKYDFSKFNDDESSDEDANNFDYSSFSPNSGDFMTPQNGNEESDDDEDLEDDSNSDIPNLS